MSTHKNKRRLVAIGALTAASALIIPAAFAADSYPPQGDSAVASAQPVVSGYRVQDLRDWTPESDPFASQLRATVPLQPRIDRNPDTQVKPELDGKSEIMLMQGDYGNSFFGSTTFNNTFTDHTLNFWQYTDYWSPWHGGASLGVPQAIYNPATSDWRNRGFEFGVLTLPSPEYTNAAHRNGVKSIAILYFDPSFRPGLTFTEMFDKDPNSQGYLIAKKLVDMAKYYGFDGYFLNQEEWGDDEEFKPFMSYLTSQGLWTQWYDTNSSFNESKAAWLRDDEHGRIHSSVFVNYGNNGKRMNSWALANGYDPYKEVFAGIEANQTGFRSSGGVDQGYASKENHSPLTSIALFTPSDHYQRGLDDNIQEITGRSDSARPFMQQQPYQWMIAQRERMYFSGMKQDVTQTGSANGQPNPAVGVKGSGWVGVADFAPARSVIQGSNFWTNFSTGKGMRSYTKGAVSNTSEWSDMGAQSILPSWQWWITGQGGATLKADFDYGEEPRVDLQGKEVALPYSPVGAYQGGNSLVLYGQAQQAQTIRLYKTNLDVKENSTAEVVWRAKDASTKARLALVFADKPGEVVTLSLGTASTDGWKDSLVDLSDFQGRTIATMGLQVEGSGDVQVNVGKLAVSDESSTPAIPAGFTINELTTDGEMNVSWQKADFASVDSYILEAVDASGNVRHLAQAYGDSRYVKKVDLEGSYMLRLRAVGKDGSISQPAELVVNRSALPSELTYATAKDANGNFTQAANSGQVELSWKAPASGTPTGYKVRLETLYAGEDNPYHGYAEYTVGPDDTSVSLPAPAEGLMFRATVQPLGVDTGAIPALALRGRYNDSYSRPMGRQDFVGLDGAKYKLVNPTTKDWQKINATGDQSWTATRGKNNRSDWGNRDENGQLKRTRPLGTHGATYSITDYAGNTSGQVVVKAKDGAMGIVDRAAPELWASPWNDQEITWGASMKNIVATARDNFSTVTLSAKLVDPDGPEGNSVAIPTTGEGPKALNDPMLLPDTNEPSDEPSAEPTAAPTHGPDNGWDDEDEPIFDWGARSANTRNNHSTDRAANDSGVTASGLSLDVASGTISGTPTWSGTRELVLTATDESGNASTMSLMLTVNGGAVTPTPTPTTEPSAEPTVAPTVTPTAAPSTQPSAQPSTDPSAQPTAEPSAQPQPSEEPTTAPSASVSPSASPTAEATAEPSAQPTVQPSQPSEQPTTQPQPSASASSDSDQGNGQGSTQGNQAGNGGNTGIGIGNVPNDPQGNAPGTNGQQPGKDQASQAGNDQGKSAMTNPKYSASKKAGSSLAGTGVTVAVIGAIALILVMTGGTLTALRRKREER